MLFLLFIYIIIISLKKLGKKSSKLINLSIQGSFIVFKIFFLNYLKILFLNNLNILNKYNFFI